MSLAVQSQQWCPTSVQVTAVQARSLRTKGKNGTNDAYATMQVAKEKFSTSVAERCVAPVWKEEAAFELPLLHPGNAERCTLRVQVLHRAPVGPDKLLGQALVNLVELEENRGRDEAEWFKLLDKNGKHDKERGEVLLDIRFMKNNMTASMFDLSGPDKPRSRMGKLKDKIRGKRKEGLSDSASAVVPSFSQPLTDSEEDEGDDEASKKKKSKLKSLFASKSNLQRNISQSMSTLGTHPERDSAIGSSRSSDLNVPSPEGKKKFKLLPHKWTESSDSKSSQAPGQANLCINGSHVYTDEPEARNGRAGSNFSLGSSGHGSLEDLRKSSTASSDSFKPPCHVPEITVEEENSEEEEEKARRKEKEEEKRKIAEMKALEIKRLEEERIKEKKRKEEERLKKEEEERKKMEEERIKEKKRKEEERLKKEEEERKKMEEERIKEKQKEERLKREEDRRRFEEEMKKLEEERIMKVKKKEEQERVRKEEEEHKKLEQEEKRRSEEIKRKEEERIKKEWEEQERRRIEEEGEKKKKAKAAEEEQLREKEKRRMIEEERVRRQDEERKLSEKRKMEEEDQAREQEKKLIEEKRIRKAEDELRMKEERDKREQEERKKAEREREKEKIRSEEERYRKEANEEKKREAEERTKRDEQKKKARDEERRIEVEENDRKITEAKKEEERKNVEEVKKRNSEEAKMVQAKAATVSRNPFEDDSTNPFDETPSTNPFEEIPSPPGPLSRTPRVSAVKPRPHAVKPLIPTENQSGHNSLEVQDINPAGKPPSVPARTKASQSDTKGPYSMLTREELISLLVKQQEHLSQKDCRIVELEQYIDNLLVRVMEEQPSILMTLSASKKAH